MSILEKVQPIETMLPERYHKMSKEDMEKRVHEIKEKWEKCYSFQDIITKR